MKKRLIRIVWPCQAGHEHETEQAATRCGARKKTVLVIAGSARVAGTYAREAGLEAGSWRYVRDEMDVRGWDRTGVEVHVVEGTYSPDQYGALEIARARYVVRLVDLDAMMDKYR